MSFTASITLRATVDADLSSFALLVTSRKASSMLACSNLSANPRSVAITSSEVRS